MKVVDEIQLISCILVVLALMEFRLFMFRRYVYDLLLNILAKSL